MNKKGFTLIELIAVIAIIAVISLIGAVSINGVRNNIEKNMFESKLSFVISGAKDWGQNNKNLLTSAVTKTVGDLIAAGTVETEDKVPIAKYSTCETKNKSGDNCIVIVNNTNGTVINKLDISIYIQYNRVYACILKNANNQNLLNEDASWSKYGDLNYYCS